MKSNDKDHVQQTIYQYKLIKKIRIQQELIIGYLLSNLVILTFLMYYYNVEGVYSWLFGFSGTQLLHLIIILLTFIQVEEATDRKWSWSVIPPWIGFKPANDINFHIYKKVHRHLFWLGLLVIFVLYPWVNASLMLSLFTWHIWLVGPRLLLIFKFRKSPKGGVLRIQRNEISYLLR